MIKGEQGNCNGCKWFTKTIDGVASDIAEPFHCAYDGLKLKLNHTKCMVMVGDENGEEYAFEPKIQEKTMIQKGDKVMHLTGDSVIRQNGTGTVFEVIHGLVMTGVIWDESAFIGLGLPANRYHAVSINCLAQVVVVTHENIGNPILRPTNRLRWLHVVPEIKMDNGTYVKAPGLIGDRTVLQQYWEDNQGNGEWRDVPTENG